jgi:hypothetical protein
MNKADPKYVEFKIQFWNWFDNLPRQKKEVFWRYKEDIAETNFYFTVWSKKNSNNEKSC